MTHRLIYVHSMKTDDDFLIPVSCNIIIFSGFRWEIKVKPVGQPKFYCSYDCVVNI